MGAVGGGDEGGEAADVDEDAQAEEAERGAVEPAQAAARIWEKPGMERRNEERGRGKGEGRSGGGGLGREAGFEEDRRRRKGEANCGERRPRL